MKNDTGNVPNTMRILDRRPQLKRRGFLTGSGLAAIGVIVVPVTTLALVPAAVHAESFTTLGSGIGKTLIRIARDIFPHDKIADRFYAHALMAHDAAAAKDPAIKTMLIDGVATLDARARARHGKAYLEVTSESDRVVLLQEIESTAFFQKIKGDLVTGLYDNKEVWPELGYEGSSWEKGGYINRGFNDINWL
jgi:hypothetical protein